MEEFITRKNINFIAREVDLPSDLDLLSIDVDGNDYWLFADFYEVQPRVVVIEYNAKWPPPMQHVMTYDATRTWNGSDGFGCSLQSLCDIASAKGYSLVGCDIIGMNAFFVRNDLCADHFFTPATAATLYQPPRYELQRNGAFKVGHPPDRDVYGDWRNV